MPGKLRLPVGARLGRREDRDRQVRQWHKLVSLYLEPSESPIVFILRVEGFARAASRSVRSHFTSDIQGLLGKF